jgi:Rieske Fe-S protein
MTTNVEDVVRRAFDDIIDAAGDLGPCPTLDDNVTVQRTSNADRRGRSWTPGRAETSGARRWVAVAAVVLIVVGVGSVALVAQRQDPATSTAGVVDLGPVDRFEVGSITSIDDPPLFVISDASTGIAVLDAHSTHLECILVANTADTDEALRVPDPEVGFIDPCHGSLFDRAGNKLAGPAARSMDGYRVTLADQRVLVDLSQPIPGDASTTPIYSGEDLDLSLPIVGRAWGDSMDFSLDADTWARLYTAWQTDIADCMHASGFPDYQAVAYPPNGSFEDLVNPLDRRYATVMGYHELPAEPNDPNPQTDETAVASGECANTAMADVYGAIRGYTDLNDGLRSGIGNAIDSFPESDAGVAATTEWATCMAELGYQYPSRLDAILTFADRPTISTEEITTRLDDLDCDIAVGYTQRQHDWEQTQIDAWRTENSDTIQRAIDQMQLVDQHLAEIEAARQQPQD